ncbi:unnamed protein product, partial [Ectocarpus sp. 13 AM-2016]
LFCFCSISPTTTPREPSRGQRWPPTPLSSRAPFDVCAVADLEDAGACRSAGARDIPRVRGRRRQGGRGRRRP